MTLVEEAGKTRVQVKYLYRHDPHETFKPENSNLEEAKRRTDSLIRKLKKEGNMDSFKEQIASKIELGTLKNFHPYKAFQAHQFLLPWQFLT